MFVSPIITIIGEWIDGLRSGRGILKLPSTAIPTSSSSSSASDNQLLVQINQNWKSDCIEDQNLGQLGSNPILPSLNSYVL